MTKPEQKSNENLVRIGCIVCRNLGYGYSAPQIAHVHTPGKPGDPRKNKRKIPLCPPHHLQAGFGVSYHDGDKTWQKMYGDENDLADQVEQLVKEKKWMA